MLDRTQHASEDHKSSYAVGIREIQNKKYFDPLNTGNRGKVQC